MEYLLNKTPPPRKFELNQCVLQTIYCGYFRKKVSA